MMHRTRIKICGMTRKEDVYAAVHAGADAVGFVFYPKSPRFIAPEKAAVLSQELPAFVSAVGLFVNAESKLVAHAAKCAGLSLLQFHGDETPEQCHDTACAANLPFIRVFRVKPNTIADDLLQYERIYRSASPFFKGILLDAWTEAYGGAGKVFNWSLVSEEIGRRMVLSGGLTAENVAGAIAKVHPFAVDVSSGVEASRGIKDAGKIIAFIRAVREADKTI